MENQEPNPASAKEKAEDAKRRADMANGGSSPDKSGTKRELDGKNDSGVEPEIHGHELPGE
jgi:hypothetical protein